MIVGWGMIVPIEYPTLSLFELSFPIKCSTGINPLIYLLFYYIFIFIYFKVYLFKSVFTHIHPIYVPKLIIYLFKVY